MTQSLAWHDNIITLIFFHKNRLLWLEVLPYYELQISTILLWSIYIYISLIYIYIYVYALGYDNNYWIGCKLRAYNYNVDKDYTWTCFCPYWIIYWESRTNTWVLLSVPLPIFFYFYFLYFHVFWFALKSCPKMTFQSCIIHAKTTMQHIRKCIDHVNNWLWIKT